MVVLWAWVNPPITETGHQKREGKCPLCGKEMVNLEEAQKVEDKEILRITYNNQKAGKRLYKKTRKHRKNKNKRRGTRKN